MVLCRHEVHIGFILKFKTTCWQNVRYFFIFVLGRSMFYVLFKNGLVLSVEMKISSTIQLFQIAEGKGSYCVQGALYKGMKKL